MSLIFDMLVTEMKRYHSNFVFVARIDPSWIRQLNDNAVNRYSLVCNVIITLCNETSDVDRLNDLGIFCAELTAACNALTSEWLG